MFKLLSVGLVGVIIGFFVFFVAVERPTVAVSNEAANVSNSGAPTTSAASTHPQISSALDDRIAQLESQLADLAQSLKLEQQSTLALQQEVAELSEQLLQPQSSVDLDSASTILENQDASAQTDLSEQISARLAPLSDEEALVAAGADTDTARNLALRLDEYTLAQLDFRDRAAREGWLDSEDYAQRRELELPPRIDIRAEVGSDVWDHYLYINGRDNRVRVASVLAGSAASNAGIEVGDFVLEYAGSRVFTVRELQRATRQGERGEQVIVRLGRADTTLDTTMPRGPLGVTLSAERRAPADNSVLR